MRFFRSLPVLGLTLVCLAGPTGCIIDVSSLTTVQPLTETVVYGKSGPKILMLELEGLLTESPGRSPFGDRPSIVALTQEILDRATEEDDIVALLLRIRSPGGTVTASETLHHLILDWKKETGKPVVVHMQGLAASGGYYVAMTADHVVAEPTTITGSIGVVMMGLNIAGLMEKLGIQNQTFASGDFKDTGSPFRAMREDERALMQGVIDDLQARFVEVVAAGRPNLAATAVARRADGRIYTARQALEVGLIDEIGFLDRTVEVVEERAGIEESRVVTYHRPNDYQNNLYSRGNLPPIQVVDIDLVDLANRLLPPGFYFIWPPALGGLQ
jgi:protease-4